MASGPHTLAHAIGNSRRPQIEWLRHVLILGLGTTSVYLSDGWLQIFLFTIACVWVFSYRPQSIAYPATWFAPIFFLYSISVPFLALSGRLPYDQFTEQILPLHATALFGFILGLGVCSTNADTVQPTCNEHERYIICWIGLILAWLLVAVAVPLLMKIGITSSKEELSAVAQNIPELRFRAMVLPAIVFAGYIIAVRILRGQSNRLIIAVHVVLLIALIALTGTRGQVLKFAVVVLLVYTEIRRPKGAYIAYILGAGCVLSLPFLQSFKYVAITGDFEYNFDAWEFIALEFRSMSFNLYHVLAEDLRRSFYFGETYLMDFGSVIGSDLLGIQFSEGVSVWYNDVIWPEMVVGRGFSLVAEGYLNGGPTGVLVIYVLLGVITRFIYIRRTRSVVWLLFWANYVPTFLFAQRQDLSIFMSLSLKNTLMPLAVVVFAAFVLSSGIKRQRSI